MKQEPVQYKIRPVNKIKSPAKVVNENILEDD